MKNERFDKLVMPNTFYCTFMEGVAKQEAIDMKEIRCYGQKVAFKGAQSPSNTLWLNRGISKKSQCGRFILALAIILACVLVVYFMFSFEISTKIYINYRANPPGVDCNTLRTDYTDDEI